MRFTLKGYVSSVEAEMLDVSDWGGSSMVAGRTKVHISWPGGSTSFEWTGHPEPKLGTPVSVTVEAGE